MFLKTCQLYTLVSATLNWMCDYLQHWAASKVTATCGLRGENRCHSLHGGLREEVTLLECSTSNCESKPKAKLVCFPQCTRTLPPNHDTVAAVMGIQPWQPEGYTRVMTQDIRFFLRATGSGVHKDASFNTPTSRHFWSSLTGHAVYSLPPRVLWSASPLPIKDSQDWRKREVILPYTGPQLCVTARRPNH